MKALTYIERGKFELLEKPKPLFMDARMEHFARKMSNTATIPFGRIISTNQNNRRFRNENAGFLIDYFFISMYGITSKPHF